MEHRTRIRTIFELCVVAGFDAVGIEVVASGNNERRVQAAGGDTHRPRDLALSAIAASAPIAKDEEGDGPLGGGEGDRWPDGGGGTAEGEGESAGEGAGEGAGEDASECAPCAPCAPYGDLYGRPGAVAKERAAREMDHAGNYHGIGSSGTRFSRTFRCASSPICHPRRSRASSGTHCL